MLIMIIRKHNTGKLTSGTCKWICEVTKKSLFGCFFIRKARENVYAILALSFITSPSCPVTSREPSLFSLSNGRRREVSINRVEPPEIKWHSYLGDWGLDNPSQNLTARSKTVANMAIVYNRKFHICQYKLDSTNLYLFRFQIPEKAVMGVSNISAQ